VNNAGEGPEHLLFGGARQWLRALSRQVHVEILSAVAAPRLNLMTPGPQPVSEGMRTTVSPRQRFWSSSPSPSRC